jgi:spore coat protein U-like protein
MALYPKRLAAFLGRHVVGLALALLLASLCVPGSARAQVSCSAAGPALTFGTVNPYSGFPYSTSGTTSYSCTNASPSPATVYTCLSIGTGSGGMSTANRTLAAGTSTIPVQITGGSAYPSQIGNGTAYPMEGPVALSLAGSTTAAGSFALAVTMPAPGSAPPPGTYMSSFGGVDAQILYSAPSFGSPATCSALIAGTYSTAQANFSITAVVPTQCTVSATSLAFPTASVLMQPVNATATISATCNASTPVTVALDNGATGTGPTARFMKSGTNAITYGIYRDAAASLPWGNTSGTDTASLSSGTGTLTAFGRVPAQVSPPPGSYADVVNVIITY